MLLLKENLTQRISKMNQVAIALGCLMISADLYAATALSNSSVVARPQNDLLKNTPHTLIADKQSRSLSNRVSQYLGAKSDLTFRDITPTQVANDFKRLQQTHNGIDVDDAIISVRFDNRGNIVRVFGTAFDDLVSESLTLHAEANEATLLTNTLDAATIAQQYLYELEPYGHWQISQWVEKNAIRISDGTGRSVLKIMFYAENEEANLYIRPELFVDIANGNILEVRDKLRRSLQAGSGLGGNVMSGAQSYDWVPNASDALIAGTFLVNRSGTQCTMEITPDVHSWKNNVVIINGPDATTPHTYDCTAKDKDDNNLGLNDEDLSHVAGAYSPLNDAAYHSQVAFNLYENFALTRDLGPLKERGRPLIVRAHYGYSDNAFWNGEYIALGDGFRSFYPKVSADTIGHELAHGVLEKYSAIRQDAGITMGISESFADIAGEVTEYVIAQQSLQTNDWLYAAENFKPTLTDAARYFEKPSIDGNSIDSAKDYQQEVKGHYLAGPFNKAFFHLITDVENKTIGWNPVLGYDLWLTAAVNCWVPGMLYDDAAQCVVLSVDSFYNNISNRPSDWDIDDVRHDVIRAFANVDIMTQTPKDLVALFDYERVFDDLVLTNKTSLPNQQTANYEWDLYNDNSVDHQSTNINDSVFFNTSAEDTEVDVKLTVTQNSNQDSYVRTIDLAPSYCLPSGTGGTRHFIQQVGLNGSNYNASASETGGYGDYTNQTPLSLKLQGDNTFVLTPGDDSRSRRWAVYVDLNGDHDFLDDGEKIVNDTKIQGPLTEVVSLNLSDEHKGKVTRMRVVLNWSINTRPCSEATSGEHEDYLVILSGDIDEPTPDPDPSFTASEGTSSFNYNFVNDSANVPEGVSWSWQYKLNSEGEYTQFSDDFEASFTFPNEGTYDVKLELTTAENDSFFSTQTLVIEEETDPGTDTYCTTSSNDGSVNIIKVVVHATDAPFIVNQQSDYSPGGYTHYATAYDQNINAGDTLYVYSTMRGPSSEDKHIGAWIDIDQNNLFEADERIILDNIGGGTLKNFSYQIPADASSGLIRLRIAVRQGEDPTVCGNIGIGEVEDYTLEIN
jgi:Zn-dependent metalloprotease